MKVIQTSTQISVSPKSIYRIIVIGVGPVQIWQQGYHNNVFHVVRGFGQVFALFLGGFIVDFEYSLFIVNVIKGYFMTCLCRKPSRRYIHGSCCKTLVCKGVSDKPYGVFFTDICL